MNKYFILLCLKSYGCYVEDSTKLAKPFEGSPHYDTLLSGFIKAERLSKPTLLNFVRAVLHLAFKRKPTFLR